MEEFELQPDEDSAYLSPNEVLLRLIRAFNFCLVSHSLADEASIEAKKTIAKGKELGADSGALAEFERTHALGCGLVMVVYDDSSNQPDCFLRLQVWPENPIHIAFQSDVHYRESKNLVNRAANALGYVVEEV